MLWILSTRYKFPAFSAVTRCDVSCRSPLKNFKKSRRRNRVAAGRFAIHEKLAVLPTRQHWGSQPCTPATTFAAPHAAQCRPRPRFPWSGGGCLCPEPPVAPRAGAALGQRWGCAGAALGPRWLARRRPAEGDGWVPRGVWWRFGPLCRCSEGAGEAHSSPPTAAAVSQTGEAARVCWKPGLTRGCKRKLQNQPPGGGGSGSPSSQQRRGAMEAAAGQRPARPAARPGPRAQRPAGAVQPLAPPESGKETQVRCSAAGGGSAAGPVRLAAADTRTKRPSEKGSHATRGRAHRARSPRSPLALPLPQPGRPRDWQRRIPCLRATRGVRNPCLREVVRVECAADRLESARIAKFQSGSALVTVSPEIFVGQASRKDCSQRPSPCRSFKYGTAGSAFVFLKCLYTDKRR